MMTRAAHKNDAQNAGEFLSSVMDFFATSGFFIPTTISLPTVRAN